ncbi:hypothetical protein [Aurantimicrobium photophilum]|uniref:Uncharacterized protein n=1 Tax=Aurantimicrobium photophilum TaxID=1987356 RepID=A0A2Z3S4L8_9MICO|nr:hypothetical protein [Aurantimicrobium photophilum]AWR21798.1 hypothetical protein AURMO_01206 [Aurantimicrobium photophilum]
MKKIAVRTLLLSLVLSIAAALGFVAPSYSTSSESITQSDHYLQGTLNSQLWRTPAFTAVGFVSGGTTFTITPALPAGLSMSTSGDTATISGTPTVAYAPVTHTVTASGTSTTTGSAATATATIQVSVASVITVTSNVSQLPASTLVTTPITASFSHDSFISGTTGGVSFITTGFVPNNTTDCSDVTLSVSSAGCTINATQNSVSYNWTGIDFDANTNFVVTMLANAFTTPNGQGAGSSAGLNINLSQTPGSPPQMNFGGAMVTIGSSPQNQQSQSTPFTVGSSSFQRGSSPSFSTLAVGANVPAFTMTFGGYSAGAAVDQINYILGDPYNDIFYTVPGSVSSNSQNYAAWNPSSSTCGITAIRIGGVTQTANSGITCVKSTSSVSGSATQYWNAVKFATPTSAEISIDTAAGVFVVSQAGNLNYFATLFNNSVSPRWMAHVSQPFDGANPTPSAPASPVSFTIPVAPGQKIVGEDVTISATDLALSTDYAVVLRSTPQILAQGRTVSSSFNTSVTIPDNLEAGWHSITFSATRSDGAAVEEKVYFKITADGTLLATSTDTPAELAFTGALTAGAIPLSIIALVMGFIAFFIAREINPDFMRVMTLTRNADGELDFVKRRIRSIDF